MEAVLESPVILLSEKKITSMRDLLPILEAGRQVVQADPDHRGKTLKGKRSQPWWSTKTARHDQCGRSKSSWLRRSSQALLEDIAVLTGGKVISDDLGIKLENVKVEDLGRAKKVTIDKDTTTIIDGAGDKEALRARVKTLERKSKTLPQIMIARSCKSASQNSSAAWQ